MYLVECESVRTDPGMSSVFVAVVEDFASQPIIGIISGVLPNAIELRIRQQQTQSVRFFYLFFFFRDLSFPILNK